MGDRPPNATERRLKRVRALKAEFFADQLSTDEQLAAKDARIAELEHEVEVLRLQVERSRPRAESRAPGRTVEGAKPSFDFYRD